MTDAPPPPAAPRRPVPVLWIAVGVAAALVIGGGTALALRDASPPPANPVAQDEVQPVASRTTIHLEPSGEPGTDPFTDRRVTAAATFPQEVTAAAVDPAGLTAGTPGGPLLISGDTAALYAGSPAGNTALYGGSNEQDVCDADALIAFLTANPAKAAAWAAVHSLAPADLTTYIRSLTPVVLTADTTVTNHGFAAGRAVARQSVMQAGTAVLVDPRGVPAVRCACGNPLLPPETVDLPAADLAGTPWAGFDPARVLAVRAAAQDQATFTLVDVTSGAALVRQSGTTGPGLLVAAGAAGISTSPDGVTWTLVPGSPATDAVEYGGTQLLALSHTGEYPDITTAVQVSSDGATWTKAAELPGDLTELSHDGERWVLAGSAAGAGELTTDESQAPLAVATSADGRTWNPAGTTIPTGEWPSTSMVLSSLATAGTTWLADLEGFLGDGPVQTVARSSDAGATWTVLDWSASDSPFLRTKGFGVQWSWTGAGWGAVASQSEMVGLDEGYLPHARGGTSTDGAAWTFAAATPDALAFSSLTWDADRRWVAAASDGLASGATTSVQVSADLLSWTALGAPAGGVLDVAVLPGTLPAGFVPPVASAPAPTPEPAPAPAPAPAGSDCVLQSENGEQAWAESYPGVAMTCDAMIERWRRYETWPGEVQGMVAGVDFGDGWECSSGWVPLSQPEYYDGSLGDCWTGERADGQEGLTVWRGAPGQRLTYDGAPAPFVRPAPAPAENGPAAAAPGAEPEDEITVSRPESAPACDGTPIVIYGAAAQRGLYDVELQSLLNRYPEASWLRTDRSCSSFNQQNEVGDPIYAVYRPFGSVAEACGAWDAEVAAGGSPSTRYLSTGTPLDSTFSCS